MKEWLIVFRKDNHPILKEFGKCQFEHDNLMHESDKEIIVIDGLILNQKELFEKHQTHDFLQLVLKMRQLNPNNFFCDFRGPFTGVFYDKLTKNAVVFTNQTGDSAVFYYLSENLQVFSSNFTILLNDLKNNQIPVSFDEKAAHWMLTFGYLVDKTTFAKEIKRLCAGKAIYLENGKWTEKTYHRFVYKNLQVSENEAIENIDKLFKKAVRRCFEKDLEYGYTQHIVDISAGLDSRMVNCVAKKLGYSPITNISYSQTSSDEEILSKQVSKHFGNTLIFEPLDDHEFVFDIDELLDGNFGTYLYCGITGGARLLSKIDFENFGAEQTGLLGDGAVGGSYIKSDSYNENIESLRLAHKLPLRFNPNEEQYDKPVFGLYTRGFMGIMSSWFVRKHYTFALSPFNDVEFLEYCHSLPVEMRRDHQLYWKWVEKCHPEALEVPINRKRVPITKLQKWSDSVEKLYHKGLKAWRLVFFKLGLVPSRVRPDASMNPYEYWYDTDPKMRAFFDDYYHENIGLISENKQLSKELEVLFKSRIVLEKTMALTVLGMAKKLS